MNDIELEAKKLSHRKDLELFIRASIEELNKILPHYDAHAASFEAQKQIRKSYLREFSSLPEKLSMLIGRTTYKI
jgi:hypothetical protein